MESLRSFILDSTATAPLLLLFSMFLMGILTSNIGMLMTVVGAMLVVPTLHTLSTRLSRPLSSLFNPSVQTPIKAAGGALYIGGPLFLSGLLGSLFEKSGLSTPYASFILSALMIGGPLVGEKFGSGLTPGQTLNPLRWFMESPLPLQGEDAKKCALLPLAQNDTVYASPSSWTLTMLFLLGLFFANAIELHNFKIPSVTTTPSESLKRSLEEKETLRKRIAIVSMTAILALTLATLYFRIVSVGCESVNDIPLFVWSMVFGVSWYAFLTTKCGIRATDLFGIVSSYVPPSVLQKPIVCTA